jgi:hypothetical protein
MVISLRDETLELGGSDEIESIEGFKSGKIGIGPLGNVGYARNFSLST